MLKWHLVRIEGVRKLADKMMCMRQPERERKRERRERVYRKRINTATATLSATLFDKSQRVQSIIKEKSHKFQRRLFIRSCPNFNILFVWPNCFIY